MLSDGAPSTMYDLAVEVLRHGPISRRVLATRLDVSAASLTRLSKPLLAHGVLVEVAGGIDPETRRTSGRLDIAALQHLVVGVELTETHAWAVLTDLRAAVLDTARRELPDRDPASVARTVADLVLALAGTQPVSAVGIALGGHVDDEGRVVRASFWGWHGPVDLAGLVRERVQVPVVVGNDLAALTRAEHWFGEGRGSTSFAVVTVGAGVGYGLVLHDTPVQTAATALQLIGHHPLVDGGPRCPDGHRGCATAVLTTRALRAAGTLALGHPTEPDQLLDLAQKGVVAARRVVDDAAGSLGRLLAAIANFTSVEKVLLAGEGVRLAVVGRDALRLQLLADRDPMAPNVQVVARENDFGTWARGAAGMAVQALVLHPGWLDRPTGPVPASADVGA